MSEKSTDTEEGITGTHKAGQVCFTDDFLLTLTLSNNKGPLKHMWDH